MNSAIEVQDLSKDFNSVRALDKVTFSVPEGHVFGYLGPNGSGKTTTVRILATLIPPTSGTAKVFGYDVRKKPVEVKKRIGLVQQNTSFEPYLTVEENLRLFGHLQGLSKSETKTLVHDLLETFGLQECVSRKAVTLSIGQRRRMQIARELMSKPALLFLDEPTIGLDVEARIATIRVFKEMARTGTTIFFTTHNLAEVDELCDTVAFLNKGRLLTVENVAAFRERARGRRLEDAYLEVVSGRAS